MGAVAVISISFVLQDIRPSLVRSGIAAASSFPKVTVADNSISTVLLLIRRWSVRGGAASAVVAFVTMLLVLLSRFCWKSQMCYIGVRPEDSVNQEDTVSSLFNPYRRRYRRISAVGGCCVVVFVFA